MSTVFRITVVAALLSAGAIVGCQSPTDSITDSVNPSAESVAVSAVSNRYIIVLKGLPFSNARLSGDYDNRITIMRQQASRLLAQFKINSDLIDQVYGTVLMGFSAKLTPEQVKWLQKSPYVATIEPDRLMEADEPERFDEPGGRLAAKQEIPWGITAVGGPTSYTGTNVAWIIDTGIDLDHPDLNVDASRGMNFITSGAAGSKTLDDSHGHGTHMAGIIAAKNNTYGVVGIAAGATVIPVKVGAKFKEITASAFMAGVDYVGTYCQAGDVVNLSVGTSASDVIDSAVRSLARSQRIFIACSAGNVYNQSDANQVSPARVNEPNLYTASAHDSKGVFATVSCSGNPPIDFSTPGVRIKSTVNNGGYTYFSEGTSMATAHLSGILLANGGTVYGKGFVTNDRDGNPDPKGSRVP